MTKMTEKALENDKALGVPLININNIYSDPEFNCRGFFSAVDCVELAKNIAENGLQAPVTVINTNHFEDSSLREKAIQESCEYILITGHRRLTSYKINEQRLIPAIIKNNKMSLFEAKDLNAIENIQRKDLTLWQEALTIRHYWKAGWTYEKVKERVGKSIFWVSQRYKLLEMPEEIQEMANQGYIKSSDINALIKLKDPIEQLKAAGFLKTKRKKGEGRNILHHIKKKDPVESKKVRKREDIFDMMDHIRDTFKHKVVIESFTENGNCLATRVMAWVAGEIMTLDVLDKIKEIAEENNIFYEQSSFIAEEEDVCQ